MAGIWPLEPSQLPPKVCINNTLELEAELEPPELTAWDVGVLLHLNELAECLARGVR